MTNATYTLHMALLRLAKGMLNAWERWVVVTCSDTSGSIELPIPTDGDLASREARQMSDRSTQPSVAGDDRQRRSVVVR
jgi:hypothetical protein